MGSRKPIKLRKLEKLRRSRKVRKLQDLQGSPPPTVINAVNNGKLKTARTACKLDRELQEYSSGELSPMLE